ncbi:MAG: arsenate reductase (glutaredoxin) [Deltaproteobacteria bacterium]|nr:MAG: arsenate reductase (glutaredoxin) [Deltaproteobacteria bacterium]
MTEVVVYHNPRCSKSRATVALLRARGIEPRIVEYLKTPPSTDEVLELARRLGRPVVEILRRKEPEYADLGLSPDTPDPVAAEAVARHPRLLERPIVVVADRAAIGRPPEAVLEILP